MLIFKVQANSGDKKLLIKKIEIGAKKLLFDVISNVLENWHNIVFSAYVN